MLDPGICNAWWSSWESVTTVGTSQGGLVRYGGRVVPSMIHNAITVQEPNKNESILKWPGLWLVAEMGLFSDLPLATLDSMVLPFCEPHSRSHASSFPDKAASKHRCKTLSPKKKVGMILYWSRLSITIHCHIMPYYDAIFIPLYALVCHIICAPHCSGSTSPISGPILSEGKSGCHEVAQARALGKDTTGQWGGAPDPVCFSSR